MTSSPPRYDSTMQPALPLYSSTKTRTRRTEVVVELSRTQPPLLPIALQNYVSPHTWETRVRAITRLAFRYSNPMVEACWMLVALLLTFVIPIAAYNVSLARLNDTPEDQQYGLINQARLIAFGVMLGVWFFMFLPIAIWKYIGSVRVNNMVERWGKEDVQSASSYVSVPTWKVTMPSMFRNGIVMLVSCPAPPSSFDLEAYLPPYIAAPNEAAPSYEVTKRFSGLQGDRKFGEIPLYNDDKEVAA